MSQFLTAVFELLPTNRKAAALERVRAASENAFWDFVDGAKADADKAIALPKKERRTETRRICAGALKTGIKHKLVEPVGHGMARDADMAVSSYIELRAGGHDANWPQRNVGQSNDLDAALDALAASSDMESERAARDAMAKARKVPGVRPVIFGRARDALIVKDEKGRLAVVLLCQWASDKRSRAAKISPGVDPTTGEILKGGKSKAKLVIPLACSKWHQNKFLNGSAILRSSLVFRRQDRWFMAAQFEMPVKKAELSGAVLGIDRGVVYPISAGVVDKNGALIDLMEPQGKEIGEAITASDQRRRNEARRRGITTFRHQEVVQHSLHRMANDVVKSARKYGAEVAVERLTEMKQVITTKRQTGARKGGWRRVLKKMQLGEFEKILEYKLALAGLPKVREVLAAGTSQTCPACGHKAKENRAEREVFKCVKCDHIAHADQNASIIIARRGVLMRTLKKGDKLDALHQNMVASLRTRDDGGLGRDDLFITVVPAHVPDAEAYEDKASSLTSALGQKVTLVDQNASTGVFPAGIDAIHTEEKHRKHKPDQGLP